MSVSSDDLNSPWAWPIAWAAFTTGLVVFGVVYSFGIFLQPMMRDLHAGEAATSALFSAVGLAFYMLGPLTGYLADKFGPRLMVLTGAALMSAGLMLTGLIKQLWVGYLTYGALVGLGAACAYVPALSIVGGWFNRRRDAALGLAAAGTGCGTLIAPPVIAGMIERIGWRPTFIVIGAGCGLLLTGCAVVVRAPPRMTDAVRISFRGAVFSGAFVTLYISWVFGTVALFVPFVFLPSYALKHGASPSAASALLSTIGGMSILGRLAIGFVGERVGVVRLFKAAVLWMGASYVLWLLAGSYAWLLAFTVVLGLGYGIRIALVPSVMIAFFGMQNLGALLGMFFTATGVASLVSPLLASYITAVTNDAMWGIVLALAAGLLGFAVILPLGGHRDPQTARSAA